MSTVSPRGVAPRPATMPAFLALSCIGAFTTAPALAADADRTTATPKATTDTADVQHRDEILVNGHRERDAGPKQVAPLVDTPRSIIVLPDRKSVV